MGPRFAGQAKLSYRRIITKPLAKTIANEFASPSCGVVIADATHVVVDTQDEQQPQEHTTQPSILKYPCPFTPSTVCPLVQALRFKISGRGAISGKTPNNFEVFYQKVRHFIGLT